MEVGEKQNRTGQNTKEQNKMERIRQIEEEIIEKNRIEIEQMSACKHVCTHRQQTFLFPGKGKIKQFKVFQMERATKSKIEQEIVMTEYFH